MGEVFWLPKWMPRAWLGMVLPVGGGAISFASLVIFFASLVSPTPLFSSPIKLFFISTVEFSQFHFSYFLPTVRSCCKECQQLLAGVRCWLEEAALYLILCFHRAYLALKGKKNLTLVFAFTATTQSCNHYYRQNSIQLEFLYQVQESLRVQYYTASGALYLHMCLL